MDDELKQNLTAAETWMRGLFIMLFVFFLVIARLVTGAVVIIQFLFTVFSGQVNENLRDFGAGLAQFIYQVLLFITYNTDDKPFPFQSWPQAPRRAAEPLQAEADTSAVPEGGAGENATEKPQ
jgi:Domain of unknown function (DUF4389)